jgi:hypothetical protein
VLPLHSPTVELQEPDVAVPHLERSALLLQLAPLTTLGFVLNLIEVFPNGLISAQMNARSMSM